MLPLIKFHIQYFSINFKGIHKSGIKEFQINTCELPSWLLATAVLETLYFHPITLSINEIRLVVLCLKYVRGVIDYQLTDNGSTESVNDDYETPSQLVIEMQSVYRAK